MSDFRSELNGTNLIRFFDYWSALCHGRPMPSRKDIDPLQMPAGFLPNVMLIDALHDPRRYRYRLVGTNVVGATGEDRTGRFFDEVRFFRSFPTVLQQYEMVVETGQPLYSLEPFTNTFTGVVYEVDRLMLPLSNGGQVADMIMVLFEFKTGPYAREWASRHYYGRSIVSELSA